MRNRRKTSRCGVGLTALLVGLIASLIAVVGAARPAAAAMDPAAGADRMFAIVNNERASRGLAQLQRDPTLDGFALEWSGVQSAAGNIFHRSNLAEIAAATTPQWQGVAENVGMSSTTDLTTMDTLHVAFMASAGHRDNLLGNYNRVGIGVVIGPHGTFITLNFLRGPAIAAPPPVEGPPRTWSQSGFTAINPTRLIDTRDSAAIVAGGTFSVRPVDRVPSVSGATAVAVNVTVIGPGHDGFVTVYPCDSARPNASNLNYTAGDIRANLVETALGANGDLCIYTQSAAHFVVDLAGYFKASAGSRYQPTRPNRLLDSRDLGGRIQGARLTLPGYSAAVFNITVADGTLPGFVTMWPCDVAQPTVSNLNYRASETVPNLAMSRISANGEVCLYTSTPAHLIVDLQGTFSGAGGLVVPAEPRRALDTRSGLGHVGSLAANPNTPVVLDLKTAGRVPSNAIGAVLNVTVTESNAAGWLTVYPCAEGRPVASNLNYSSRQTIANNVIAKLDVNGNICLASLASTHAIVDVVGWLT